MSEISRQSWTVGETVISGLVAGPSDGQPIILLHGIPAGAELFRKGLPRLAAAGFRVYAPDLPGYGETRLPHSADFSQRANASLFAAWIEDLALGPVGLVGHDLGGVIGQILAVEHPELLRRLTLSHSPVERTWPVVPIRIFISIARLWLYPALAASGYVQLDPYLRSQLRRAIRNHRNVLGETDALARIFFDSKVTDPEGRRQFAAQLKALDNRDTTVVADRLEDVSVPTLLLWGRDDPFQGWDPSGKRLQELFGNPDVVLIDEASHFAMLDQPDAFYGALIEWGARD